jgi:lipoyl(octanoyl) transferase
MRIVDLGRMAYREAWGRQEEAHARVLAGVEELVFFVEHPPVVTLGRRPDVQRNLIATEQQLARLGVEVVQSDRGGDITFHGPGQLVVYPIIRLIDHHLSVGAYVRRLEEIVVAVLADLGITGRMDEAGIGVWVDDPRGAAAKICALGVRVRRGVSMHGIALNVTTDLNYFNLIVPCGLAGRPVTSIQSLLGQRTPGMDRVKQAMGQRMCGMLAGNVQNK